MSVRTMRDIFDTFDDEQKEIIYILVSQALEDGRVDKEYFVMFNDEQKELVYALINQAIKEI